MSLIDCTNSEDKEHRMPALIFNSSHDPILLLSTNFICYRGFGGAVSTSFSYACAFAAVKTYVDIRARVGLYGAFWIYSGISIAGLFFVCCLVPETRGVELEEMEHHNNTSLTIPTTIVSTTTTTTAASAANMNLNPTSSNSYNNVPLNSNITVPQHSTSTCSSTNPSSSAPSHLLVVVSPSNYPKIEQYPPPLRTPPGHHQQQASKKYPTHLPLNFDKPLNNVVPNSMMLSEPPEMGMQSNHSHMAYDSPPRQHYQTLSHNAYQMHNNPPPPVYQHQRYSGYQFQYAPPCSQQESDYSFHVPSRNFLHHTQYHPLSHDFMEPEYDYEDHPRRHRTSYQYIAHRGSELMQDGVIYRPNKGSIV
jgi:hypothetical protein